MRFGIHIDDVQCYRRELTVDADGAIAKRAERRAQSAALTSEFWRKENQRNGRLRGARTQIAHKRMFLKRFLGKIEAYQRRHPGAADAEALEWFLDPVDHRRFKMSRWSVFNTDQIDKRRRRDVMSKLESLLLEARSDPGIREVLLLSKRVLRRVLRSKSKA